jgi:hypothetical protein
MVEARHTPNDSVTITYLYNAQGQLSNELYATNRWPVVGLHDQKNLSRLTDRFVRYRLFTYNQDKQPTLIKQYFYMGSSYWGVFDSDSIIYEAQRPVRLYHNDYYFTSDGQGLAFWYPLWVTKRTYQYDGRGRVVAEADSVFITHDFPVGKNYIHPLSAKYVFSNQTRYEYGEGREPVKKTTVSGADQHRSLTYGNGWSVYYQFGPSWSTYLNTAIASYFSGTTTYRYDYRPDGLVSRTIAHFKDATTGKEYTSTFAYAYAP